MESLPAEPLRLPHSSSEDRGEELTNFYGFFDHDVDDVRFLHFLRRFGRN